MKKSRRVVCISEKKALIGGTIVSIILAIPASFMIAFAIYDTFKNRRLLESITAFDFAIILIPILFITSLMGILLFVIACNYGKNSK